MWGVGNKAQGLKDWQAAAFADSQKRYGNDVMAKRNAATLFLLRSNHGGEKCVANHSLYHYYELYWAPSKSKDNAQYFAGKRPEIFAQGYQGDPPPQLCYTSPELVKLVAQEARDYFDHGGYPYKAILCNAPLGLKWGENYFCVEPMDNTSFCKCANCQKLVATGKSQCDGEFFSQGNDSDYMFNFINLVAKEVKKTHPGKNLVCCAYMSHAWIPKEVKLDPYVAVQFCFASDSAPWAKLEYDHEWRLAQKWGEEAKASGRPLYAWCYFGHLYRAIADSGNFYCFPGFFAHAIAKELKMYQANGYRGMYHCGLAPEPGAYVTFRLMDDASLDVDALLDEYFTGLHGAAAAPLKQLFLEIEKVYCDPELRPKDKNLSPHSIETAWNLLGTAERMAGWGKLMDEARALAATEREKRNVELFDLAFWKYMQQGRAQYVERSSAPIPSAAVPAVPEAGGDLTKVAWDKSTTLGGGWFNRGGGQPAARRLSGRIAHDSDWLYVELTDPCDTKKLTDSPSIACYDDWELYFSSQRAKPARQFLVGPTGRVGACLNGEDNGRMFVPFPEHGAKAASDTSDPGKWVERVAIPLKNLVPGGVKPNGKVYLNLVRVSGPAISGAEIGIDTWVPFTTVIEVDRSAEITLQP